MLVFVLEMLVCVLYFILIITAVLNQEDKVGENWIHIFCYSSYFVNGVTELSFLCYYF